MSKHPFTPPKKPEPMTRPTPPRAPEKFEETPRDLGARKPEDKLTAEELDRVKKGLPPAGVSGQMPGPEPTPTPEPVEPDPKAVKHPAPKEVAPGITHIAHKKIYHVEFAPKGSGTMVNVGNFATLEEAQKALNKAKAEYDM